MSTVNNTTPDKVQPPESEWPTFILDMGVKPTDRWTIRYFADCKKDLWDPKLGWTYSAISYAWGLWHDKRLTGGIDAAGVETVTWPDDSNKEYPAFDSKIPTNIRWKFPTTNTNSTLVDDRKSFHNPVLPQFTIQKMKNALQRLGTRFVWVDFACNVQGINNLLKPELGQMLNQEQVDLQTKEVDRMKYVYPRSINGCLWLHTSRWAKAATDTKGDMQQVLEYINTITARGDGIRPTEVEKYLKTLELAVETQISLKSVWSFQEGVLFHDDSRPVPEMSKKLPYGISTCLILDENGESLTANGIHFDGLQGGDLIQDVVGFTTLILGLITEALVEKANPPAVTPNYSELSLYCQNPDKETEVRSWISRFIATGLVSYHFNSPITLLESKAIRAIKYPNASEIDATVRAIVGALDVDMGADTLKIAKAENKKGGRAEIDFLQKAFLTLLFEGYQWRMLLLAKENTTPDATKAWWPQLLTLKRSPVASIGYYLNSGGADLETMYRPRRLVVRPTGTDVYDLPKLVAPYPIPELPTSNAVIAKAKAGYFYYDLTKPASKGWTSATFYEYLKGDSDNLPGTVNLTKVNFTDATTRDAKLGKSLILLPIEDSEEKVNATSPKVPAGSTTRPAKLPAKWIRCAILANYNPVARKGVFKGIGDFGGLNIADMVSLDKDVELW